MHFPDWQVITVERWDRVWIIDPFANLPAVSLDWFYHPVRRRVSLSLSINL